MSFELVSGLVLAVLVFGGLAFGDRIADLLAAVDTETEVRRPEDIE